MNKGLFAAVMLAAAFFAGGDAAYCASKRPVGMAVFVSGDVKLRRPGAAELPQVKVNDNLYPGDSVETGAGAKASVVLLYGSEIRLNESTILELIPGKKNADSAKLARGQVWTRMLHKRGGLNVRTVTAICAVRGTEADIEQLEALKVKVYEGHVDVENEAGKVSLKAGEMTRVAGPAAAPAKAFRMKASSFGKWQEGVTPADINDFLEKLKAAYGDDKKLEFAVGGSGAEKKAIRIKLRKKGE
ncbi:MAG: FecR family protein [Elusimicrobiota bacterium]|nr:FecR family protein [Elusimicrobiota bacterium]